MLHIVLTLLQANPANVVAALIARLAATFDLGLSNLFLVPDPMLAVLLNYGAAALAWLLITAVVVRLAVENRVKRASPVRSDLNGRVTFRPGSP
jgi:hypothetical protein